MPYNPLDFFKAGQEVGKSRKSVAGYATDNILNMFNKQLENQMAIEQMKAMWGAQAGAFGLGSPTGSSTGTLPTGSQSMGDTSIGGQSSFSSGSTGEGLAVKGGKIGPIELGNLGYGAREAGLKEQSTNLAKLEPMIQSSIGILKTNIGAFKKMASENPAGTGRPAGFINWLGSKTGFFPGASSYEGLQTETAAELAKIATFGTGARLGPEIINSFKKLLPNYGSTWNEVADRTHNALMNAFSRRHYYLHPGGDVPFRPEDYESIIQDVLDTPKFKQMQVGNINPLQQSAMNKTSYNIGQVIDIRGKSYRVTNLSDPNDPDLEPL